MAMRALNPRTAALCGVVALAACAGLNTTTAPVLPANALAVRSQTSGGYQSLYSFHGIPNGAYPDAGLLALRGTLYGTTSFGGDYDGGTFYSVSPEGKEKVIYSFGQSNTVPMRPESSLVAIGDSFIGTTIYGGKNGLGSVYSVSAGGQAKILHSFGSGGDGEFPMAGLVDVKGTLYGTTESGGSSTKCTDGCGTVFSISLSGDEHVLHSFSGGKDGATPEARLLYHNGKLYGTASAGGAKNDGTVFTVTP